MNCSKFLEFQGFLQVQMGGGRLYNLYRNCQHFLITSDFLKSHDKYRKGLMYRTNSAHLYNIYLKNIFIHF